MNEVYLATSTDGGDSFDNARMSDEAFDSRVGPLVREEFGVDFGSRLGLTAGPRTAVAVWADSRFGNETTGRQDIVGAAARLPASLPLLARPATVLSLVVLGLAALVAWRLRLGRAGGDVPGSGIPAPVGDQPAAVNVSGDNP
jgi:hypothetical protein